MNKILKGIYIAVGILSLIVGCIGAALPILPTTPFLLLALYCFARGSERWHRWFIKTNLYKKYLEDFVKHRAMSLKQKLSILLFADFMLMFPLIIIDIWGVKLFIIILILIKYYYFFFRIKTIKEENNGVL